MGEDGQISEAPSGIASSAMPFLQHTPRRVTLQPRESQVIRIRLRPPGTDEPSEFRTHLTVTAVPPETAGLTAEDAAAGRVDDLSLNVIALFSMSIPIIVREGPADARAGIENARRVFAREGAPNGAVTLNLVRLGYSSIFGDIIVRDGTEIVGRVRGVAVYPEIESRAIALPLVRPIESGRTLRVEYVDDDVRPGTVLATATVAITAP